MSEPEEDPGQEREQEESLARIEAGGIPLSAERRLSELGERGGAFTSDLSVNGFALCHQLGLTPLSQVMGSSIYQMGYQAAWGQPGGGYDPYGTSMFELETLSQALNEVRGRALNRLAEEARHVGADAVVGVETRAGESELGGAGGGSLALEHVVLGTAVRRENRPSGSSQPGRQPVMTELSVADYALLLRAGIEPAGIVAWSSVFFSSYAYRGMLGQGPGSIGSMQPYELGEFTQALYNARERAMGQISAQAAALGAAGIVGVRISHTITPHSLSGGMGGTIGGFSGGRELRGMMVTFHAIGTAIHQHGDISVQAPKAVVDLFT
ncbi:MAG TPA: heavy metal-binding domain-containing protein [Solirubrobacteraceae bacterium]